MTKELITINDQSFTEKDVFQGIDSVLIHLNDTGDFSKSIGIFNSLESLESVSGKAKAYLLWGMDRWFSVNKPDEDFGDHIESKSKKGTKRITVLRYVNVWEQIDQERIPKRIQDRPMRELVPIANMLAQGFEPTKAEWDKVYLAQSGELGEVLSKIKGTKQRKSARKIMMERDGSIWLYKDDKPKKHLGFLNVEEADEDIVQAIEYIIHDRIIRK